MAGGHRCRCCGGGGPAGGCFTNPGVGARLDVNGSFFNRWYAGPGGALSEELEISVNGHALGTFAQDSQGSIIAGYNPSLWFFTFTGRKRLPLSGTPDWQPITKILVGLVRHCNCLQGRNGFGVCIRESVFPTSGFTSTIAAFGGYFRISGAAGAQTETFFGIESAQSVSGGVQWHDNATISGAGGPNASLSVGGRKHAILNSSGLLYAEAEGSLAASLSGFNEGPFASTRCNPGQTPGVSDGSLSGPVGPVSASTTLARALRRAA